MRKLQLLSGVDDRAFAAVIITVSYNFLYVSPGVCSRKHKAHLTDIAVHYESTVFLQMVRIDGQCLDIPMLNKISRELSALSVVEFAVDINTLVPVFKPAMSENVVRVVVRMIPYDGHGLSVVVLERVAHYSETVGTADVVSRSPPAEVIDFLCHFELPPLLHPVFRFFLRKIHRRCRRLLPAERCCCLPADLPSGRPMASCQ